MCIKNSWLWLYSIYCTTSSIDLVPRPPTFINTYTPDYYAAMQSMHAVHHRTYRSAVVAYSTRTRYRSYYIDFPISIVLYRNPRAHSHATHDPHTVPSQKETHSPNLSSTRITHWKTHKHTSDPNSSLFSGKRWVGEKKEPRLRAQGSCERSRGTKRSTPRAGRHLCRTYKRST